MGVKLGLSPQGMITILFSVTLGLFVDWWYLRMGQWREYLSQGEMKYQEDEETCVMKDSAICTLHQHKEDQMGEKYIQYLNHKILSKVTSWKI
jgi:hypothetical protein